MRCGIFSGHKFEVIFSSISKYEESSYNSIFISTENFSTLVIQANLNTKTNEN
jgi:hypothetical protein